MIPATFFCDACGAANKPQASFCRTCGNPLQNAGAPSRNTSTGRLLLNYMLKQRYCILDSVGKGGMGAVYRAEDTQLGNRLVAVKEMSQSGLSPQEAIEAADQFKQEALLLANLKHPNLPSIYDHFSAGGRWYLVMDFIEGETLQERIDKAKGHVLPIDEALDIGVQLCKVLGYLHSRPKPIVFRDLKPLNIMLTPDGNVYLIDFGIARLFKPGQAKDTVAYVSAGYAAPEQFGRAQTTPQSDIYSLGATLHQLLSGSDPTSNMPLFQFKPLQSFNPAIPLPLATLIARMVNTDPAQRPASMAAIRQELEQVADQWRHPPVPRPVPVPVGQWQHPPVLPTVAVPPPPSVPRPVPVPVRQNKGVSRRVIVIGLIGLVAVGGIVLATSHSSPQPSSPAQPSFPNIQGTYRGSYQFSTSSFLPHPMTLAINQQNQQDFGGTCILGGNILFIQNGTVDTNGNIQFSIPGIELANGKNVTITFTGTAQSVGSWQGSFSDTDNNQGTWSVT